MLGVCACSLQNLTHKQVSNSESYRACSNNHQQLSCCLCQICVVSIQRGTRRPGQNRAARKMILDYLSSWKDYDQQPEGFKKSKQWLEQAPAAEEATRALHVLASRHERNCINWDWAYTFRRALRKQAELRVKQEVEHLR